MSREDIYRLALLNLSDTVVITDEYGKFTFVCPNINIIFGCSSEEVMSMPDIHALAGNLPVEGKILEDRGEISNIEITVRDKGGKEHVLLVNVKRVSVSGGTRLYSFRDITERKRAETEAQAATEAKERFLSVIAHDLRNPFNALTGFSELLLSGFDEYNDKRKKEYIGNIAVCSRHMHSLLENLLMWSEFQTDGIRHTPVRCDPGRICSDVTDLLRISAERKDIRISLRMGDGEYVYADENMLALIFRNLISNAVKFSDRGGEIVISSQDAGEYREISISDEGVGISEEDIGRILGTDIRHSTPGTARERNRTRTCAVQGVCRNERRQNTGGKQKGKRQQVQFHTSEVEGERN